MRKMSAGDKAMLNIGKYLTIAAVGAGLAIASAPPASAHGAGAYGYYHRPYSAHRYYHRPYYAYYHRPYYARYYHRPYYRHGYYHRPFRYYGYYHRPFRHYGYAYRRY